MRALNDVYGVDGQRSFVRRFAVSLGLAVALAALLGDRGVQVDRSDRPNRKIALEVSWSIIPFALLMIFFVWAAKLFYAYGHPPDQEAPTDETAPPGQNG